MYSNTWFAVSYSIRSQDLPSPQVDDEQIDRRTGGSSVRDDEALMSRVNDVSLAGSDTVTIFEPSAMGVFRHGQGTFSSTASGLGCHCGPQDTSDAHLSPNETKEAAPESRTLGFRCLVATHDACQSSLSVCQEASGEVADGNTLDSTPRSEAIYRPVDSALGHPNNDGIATIESKVMPLL
jgi:hypothetical protein